MNGKLRPVNKFLPGSKGRCLPVRSPSGHASWLVGEQESDRAEYGLATGAPVLVDSHFVWIGRYQFPEFVSLTHLSFFDDWVS